MNDIVAWLKQIEQLAHTIYVQAGEQFPHNPLLTQFLRHLAKEEMDHCHIIDNAADVIRDRNIQMPGIEIDSAIKERVEAPLHRLVKLLSEEDISENQIFDFVIDTEFSEWNDIFLYVVNSLKVEDRVFDNAADKIEEHLHHIELFFNNVQHGREKLEQLRALPDFWKGTILIVDDEEAIVTLLSELLDDAYRTDTAQNGEEALAMMKLKQYDVVFSDMDMPGLNGMELFEQAAGFTEHPERKFIFYTASLSPEKRKFIENNRLRYLPKPSSILAIQAAITEAFRERENQP